MEITIYVRVDDACDAVYWEFWLCGGMYRWCCTCDNDVITFGTIVAFMIYIRLFTQPLTQLAQAATNLQSTAAASERVFEFLAEEELEDESEKTVKLEMSKVMWNLKMSDLATMKNN